MNKMDENNTYNYTDNTTTSVTFDFHTFNNGTTYTQTYSINPNDIKQKQWVTSFSNTTDNYIFI